MVTTRNPEQMRARLLQAAANVLMTDGPALSLESVARGAGVSKGGLLHHFPSRDALLTGLAADLSRRFQARVEAAYEEEQPARPGAWLRAYIHASFQDEEQDLALMLALAPLLPDTASLEDLQREQRPLMEALQADGLGAARAHAIRAACDGYWLGQVLPLTRLDGAERDALRDELLAWTRA